MIAWIKSKIERQKLKGLIETASWELSISIARGDRIRADRLQQVIQNAEAKLQ